MKSIFKLNIAFIALLPLLVQVAQADEPVQLRYRFSDGKPLKYLIHSTLNQTSKVLGQETKTVMETEMVSEYAVQKQHESGMVELQHTNKKFKTDLMVPPLINYSFDSENRGVPSESVIASQINPIFEKISDAKVILSIHPNGKIDKVSGYDEVLKAAFDSNPSMKQFLGNLNDESAHKEFSEMFPQFSPQPVKQGDSWEVDFDQPLGEMGSIKGKKRYTCLGPSVVDGRICTSLSVSYNAEIKLDLDQGPAKVKGVLKTKDSGGTIDFDPVAGEVVQIDSFYLIDGKMQVDSAGQTLEVETSQEQKLVVKQIGALSTQ